MEGRCDKCDTTGYIDDIKFSKNFTLKELTWSDTARARLIPNDPTVKQVDRLVELVRDLLQPLRDDVGPLLVTSGFRSKKLNQAIGGAKNSAHMAAYAADVVPTRVSLEHLMEWFKKTNRPFDQAIIERSGSKRWLHIGLKHPDSGEQRRQLLRYDNGKYSPCNN